jgi:hypothetical protein
MGQFTVMLLAAATFGNLDGVRTGGRWYEPALRRAVHGAAARLSDPACARVLTDFRDRQGRPLRDGITRQDADTAAYVRRIFFYDGSAEAPCRRPGVYAFTAPGSRVVRACESLGWLATTEGERAQAVVIHEVLHTLGLGDDRPSSEQITAAVERRCATVAGRASR